MPAGVFPEFEAGAYGLPAVSPARTEESQPMLDVFMLVIGIGFFAAGGRLCVRLRPALKGNDHDHRLCRSPFS